MAWRSSPPYSEHSTSVCCCGWQTEAEVSNGCFDMTSLTGQKSRSDFFFLFFVQITFPLTLSNQWDQPFIQKHDKNVCEKRSCDVFKIAADQMALTLRWSQLIWLSHCGCTIATNDHMIVNNGSMDEGKGCLYICMRISESVGLLFYVFANTFTWQVVYMSKTKETLLR